MATAVELACTDFTDENDVTVSSPTHLIANKFRFQVFRKLSLTGKETTPVLFFNLRQVVILVCSIFLIICLLQIPTILYYTNSPSFSNIGTFDVGIDVDFKACSVSHIALQAVTCVC